MTTTTAIIHDHRSRAKKNQEAMLEIRITTDRRHVYLSTGIKVRKAEWVAGRVINRLDAPVLNDRLAIIYKKVGDEVNRALAAGREIKAREIRRQVFEVKEAQQDDALLKWLAAQIPVLNVSEGTRKHYWPLIDRLEEFDKMHQWEDVTTENIYEFDAFLHARHKELSDTARLAGVKPQKLSDAGIYNYHKRLRALLYRAERFGKLAANPYARLRGQFSRGDTENTEYLTEDEMTAIRQLDLERGSTLDISRDLFVFQMYTGLAYSDAQAFDFSKYKRINGAWRYIGRRRKTSVAYVSELLPPAVEIIQKYQGQVPHVNNADYNHRLKEIGRMAGIETRMHSHLARHTFATWMLSNNVKMESVKQMLGHKSIITTQRYAKVLAENVYEDYDKVKVRMT